MKKKFLTLFAIILLAGTSCQEVINIEEEKEAIINVLEEETDANLNKDFNRFSNTWLQDETAIGLGVSKNYYIQLTGWEEIGPYFNERYENNPEPRKAKVEKINYKIKIYTNSAWANYDEAWYNDEGELVMMLIINKVLEKVNGDWKIVFTSTIDKLTFEEEVEKEEAESE